jgi:hypothetical protein
MHHHTSYLSLVLVMLLHETLATEEQRPEIVRRGMGRVSKGSLFFHSFPPSISLSFHGTSRP